MATPSDDVQVDYFQLAVAALAVVAMILAIFAVGRSMAAGATGSGTGAGSDTSAATTTGDVVDVGTEVAVALGEYSITPDTDPIPVGSTLAVSNDGAIAHNLQVKGAGLQTADLAAGEQETLDISGLAPGTYEWICAVPGHEAAGMAGTFTVAEGAVEAAGDGDGEAGDAEPASQGAHEMTAADMESLMAASFEAFPADTDGLGAQVMEPEILDDGTKLFELVVDEIQWEVEPDVFVDAMAFNGQIPGPTLKADVGDRVIVRIVNELDEFGTSLHPHGVRDHDFRMDGVSYVSQDPIAPGDSMDYVFEAERPSVGMYHSHHMSVHQVVDGLAGAFIIGDYAELAGIDGVVDEVAMTLNDAGAIGLSLNGKSFPATTAYSWQQGDKVIVHYFNEGLTSHPMHLHNQDGLVIAKDGYMLPAPYYMDVVNVAPGERYTVVYEMDNPGTWLWHCHILTHVERNDGSHFGMVTAIEVEG